MKKEVLEKISALIIASFGLVAALAWNAAIQEIFKQIFGSTSGIIAMLFYAIIVTVIAVWITIKFAKLTENANKNINKLKISNKNIKRNKK
ncbi:MAG: DUF5654 family protein [Candidatus ainarchaeum sp.]|nr:DUF5654 family protein [Candidatus ainarchaeum sp.]